MCIKSIVLIFGTVVTIVAARLELVHLVFRHGQRTPDSTYPTDPHANYTFFPYGLGQLTNKGKQDQFEQGKFLRGRYNAFLGKIYSPRIMTVHSSDIDRTHMSAQLAMAGLWSPESSQQWNPKLNWQPIAVHSKPMTEDNQYTEEFSRVLKSAEVEAILDKNNATKLYAELTALTGMDISTPHHINYIYSTLKAEEELSLPLPDWTRRFYPKQLLPLAQLNFHLLAYNKKIQKLRGGPLLKKILDDSKDKAAGLPDVKEMKLFVYSGHDTTVTNFLQTLQIWDNQLLPYGSMVIVELHRRPKRNTYAIKIFLRNDTSSEPYPLILPGCKLLCPLEKFVALTEDVIPKNWSESCKVDDGNSKDVGI